MNRTDRLYALTEELRARAPRPVGAVALAARFEVSVRTIERDFLALQHAGVPIWAQPGPGGGYGLNVEMTLPPLNLTPAEAAAVATALAATRGMPFSEAGRSALQKLTAVMAARPKDAAAKLVSRIRVAPGPGAPADPVATTVQRALLDAAAVGLTYRDAAGQKSERIVEPAGLIGTGHGWYLVAWCRLRLAPRAFRLDRITHIELTAETIAPRPLDSLLAEIPYEFTEPSLI